MMTSNRSWQIFEFLIVAMIIIALPSFAFAQENADTTDTSNDTTSVDTDAADTTTAPVHFIPMPDRWRSIVPPPYEINKKSKKYDPYNQNILKGDYPIWGQNTFFIFTATTESFTEFAHVPTPSGISTFNPLSMDFFADGEKFFFNQNIKLTFELYHGQTAYRPRDWEIKITPVFNLNYLNLRENNGVNINVRKGDNRTDAHIAFQELSFEKHLFNLSDRYDFVSFKGGIQRFSSDFRSFIFNDYNLGYRLFGNYSNNKYQYNFIYLNLLEKETNSELNTIFEDRDQDVLIFNLYKQDFLGFLGYTAEFSFHHNRDAAATHYDVNGRLVRPAPIGRVREHEINAYYWGWAGEGHFGRLNISHALYHVSGTDDFNQIAAKEININAQMAALELSIDVDWMRYKVSFFYASGDDNPLDDQGKGFDAILDLPFFAGGPFSYWQQQGIGLGGVALVHKLSLLPSLRTNKLEGQANFVNPGLLLLNFGYDAELTPKLKLIANMNYLRFSTTRTLEHFLNQGALDNNIGLDYSLGLIFRPFLNNNSIFTFGLAALSPFEGFKDIFETDATQLSGFMNMVFTY